MTYKINGTELTIQPTSGRWLPRETLGIDGNGKAIYPGVRQFEMRFGLLSDAASNQLQGFFDSLGITGTAVVDLPTFRGVSYVFFSYSGCSLREPEVGTYFTTYEQDIVLLVTNIRT